MNKLYLGGSGVIYKVDEFGLFVKILSIPNDSWDPVSEKSRDSVMWLIGLGYYDLIANNYQEKPKCSQPDSRLSSSHASETTAKSRGLLSRLCSVFSSNAKK